MGRTSSSRPEEQAGEVKGHWSDRTKHRLCTISGEVVSMPRRCDVILVGEPENSQSGPPLTGGGAASRRHGRVSRRRVGTAQRGADRLADSNISANNTHVIASTGAAGLSSRDSFEPDWGGDGGWGGSLPPSLPPALPPNSWKAY